MSEIGETGWLGGHVLARGGSHGVLANDTSLDIMITVLDTTSIGYSQPYCSGV